MRIPPLKIKILLESNPLKSRVLAPRLAVALAVAGALPGGRRLGAASVCLLGVDASKVVRDFKDTVYPFFESDTLFLECVFVLLLVV